MNADPLNRDPDSVEFVLTGTVRIAVTGNVARTEDVETDSLEYVALYAEGEYLCQYDRGEIVASEDAPFVRQAADVAGVYLDDEDGELRIPGSPC